MLASEIVRDIEQALAVEEPARGLHLVDHLLRTFPGHLRARTLRAKALLALGESDEAAGDAATVLSADLLNVEAMLVSAKLAEAQGDLHQSHALIGRAASVDSGHSGVRQAVDDSVAMLPRDPSALGFAYLNSNWPANSGRRWEEIRRGSVCGLLWPNRYGGKAALKRPARSAGLCWITIRAVCGPL